MKPFRTVKEKGKYAVERAVTEDEIIRFACQIVGRRFKRGTSLSSSSVSKRYFSLKLAGCEYEVFAAVFLDNQHQVLGFEELFKGTIDGCAVYPREVVKRALFHNAAAVIFVHNHPSGIPEPSSADKAITNRLKQALATVDIRVLDHFVVGGNQVESFQERGKL